VTTIWTARVARVDAAPDRWSLADFTTAREKPWRVPVLVDHDRGIEVGCLYFVRERAGWIEADFFLLDDALGREAAEVMRVGQPVSVGATQLKRPALRWVNELSLVERGAIPGAQVIARREVGSPAPPPTLATREAAAPPPREESVVIHGDGIIRRPGIGQVLGVR
jgi:hypothetical protein